MNEAFSLIAIVYGLAIVIAMGGAVLIRLIVGALALGERRPQAHNVAAPIPAAPPPGTDGIPAHHLVVIAAAAHAMVGAHRIVHIGAASVGRAWTAEGRLAQHASHHPSNH